VLVTMSFADRITYCHGGLFDAHRSWGSRCPARRMVIQARLLLHVPSTLYRLSHMALRLWAHILEQTLSSWCSSLWIITVHCADFGSPLVVMVTLVHRELSYNRVYVCMHWAVQAITYRSPCGSCSAFDH